MILNHIWLIDRDGFLVGHLDIENRVTIREIRPRAGQTLITWIRSGPLWEITCERVSLSTCKPSKLMMMIQSRDTLKGI